MCAYFRRSKLSLEQTWNNLPNSSQIAAKNVWLFAGWFLRFMPKILFIVNICIVNFLILILARKMSLKNVYPFDVCSNFTFQILFSGFCLNSTASDNIQFVARNSTYDESENIIHILFSSCRMSNLKTGFHFSIKLNGMTVSSCCSKPKIVFKICGPTHKWKMTQWKATNEKHHKWKMKKNFGNFGKKIRKFRAKLRNSNRRNRKELKFYNKLKFGCENSASNRIKFY